MEFNDSERQEIEQIVAEYLTSNGQAIEVEEDVETVQSVEDVQGYMLPLVQISGATFDYKKIPIPNFVDDVTDEVGRDGVLTTVTWQEFNTIFGTSYTPSSSS